MVGPWDAVPVLTYEDSDGGSMVGSVRMSDEAGGRHVGGHVPDDPASLGKRHADDDARRLDADRLLCARIAEAGFTGADHDRLIHDLAAYGIRVCEGWLATGLMFRACASQGRPVGAAPADWSAEDRTELALETVANAVRSFHDYALVKGEWKPDRGASLKTYFVGRCILAFPNVFRYWQRERRGWDRTDLDEEAVAAMPDAGPDLEDQLISRMELRHRLAILDARTAAALTLVNDGYSQAEVGEILQVTSRAVEALLYRHRAAAPSTTYQPERRRRDDSGFPS
jgi:DNA-directed RNA polymerase specialized sigma24 family protein